MCHPARFLSQNGTAAQMFTINQAQNDPTLASAGATPAPRQNGGMSFGWLLGVLWRGKLWILLLGLVGAVIGALLGGLLTPRYQSTAQLIIDPRDLRVLQNEVSPNAINNDSTTAYLESQARIIASDTVKNRVIDREKLVLDPEFGAATSGGAIRKALEGFGLASPDTGRVDSKLAALYVLDRNVSVRRGERTFVIDITATTQDPAKSARIANALANAYLDDQNEVRSDVALRASTTLNARLEELRNRLRLAEEKSERYKEANNIIGAGGKLINEDQLIQVNTELAKLRTKVAETKAKYDQTLLTRASSVEAGSVPEAVASNTMTALRAQLGAALNKEADLLASLGARHPLLFAAQQQVRDARRQISDELTRISQAAKAEYDRVRAAEKQLMDRIEELKRGQVTASRSFVQLREIEREIESSRTIYDAFLRRARETGELVGIDTTNARIISFAVPPQARTGISRRVLAILGGLAGLGLGVLLVLGRAWSKGPGAELLAGTGAAMRAPVAATSGQTKPTSQPAAKSFRSMTAAGAAAAAAAEARAVESGSAPQASTAAQSPAPTPARPMWRRFGASGEPIPTAEPTEAAGAPLLATLPAVSSRRWLKASVPETSVFQGKGLAAEIIDNPGSAFSKAIRQVRCELQGLATKGVSRRILVTALRPGAGTSVVALNLALAAAQDSRTPLLVDAGRGEKSLTQLLAADAELGLADVVSGATGLVRAALQDEATGVFFLPRASATAAPAVTAEKIASEFFPAARRFDPMIVDGSAIGTDDVTQAFAASVDDIVLVVRKGAAGRADLAQASAILGVHAAKIRGFVLNEG